jgi:hypothetical protein
VLFGCGHTTATESTLPSTAAQDESTNEGSVSASAVADAWTTLRSRLVGSWEATTDGGAVIRMSHRLVSGDTALVEQFVTPSGRETMTVLHRADEGLLLTHYCGQGNQPRLRLSDASADRLTFQFQDATNVEPDQSVLTTRTFAFHADGFDLTEIYTDAEGVLDTTILRFVPSVAAPAD